MPQFIATCPPGFEYLLVDELKSIGATEAKEGLMQVVFDCDWAQIYQVLLWSRLANRILYPISRFRAENDDELYQEVKSVNWELHIPRDGTLAVDFVSRKSFLDHERFAAQRVKDAVVDYFNEEFGERPSVDTFQPDVRLHCRINKNQAVLCIDLSGASLHQRGYRSKTGQAPLKENFAALLLYRSKWPELIAEQGVCVDPMCGSGTIAIEAAMMAADLAPGLNRDYWGFQGWKAFHRQYWQAALDQAQQRFEQSDKEFRVIANDIDGAVIEVAKENAIQAGVAEYIEWHVGSFEQLTLQQTDKRQVVVSNPPYGERLEDSDKAERLYQQLGLWLKEKFSGQHALIMSSQKEHGHAMGIRADKVYRLLNGPIEVELIRLELVEQNFIDRSLKKDLPWDVNLSDSATMLLNRLKKNVSSLKSFLSQQHITCYRLYDADLPEYAAAVDVYDNHLHIQEYAAPKSVDSRKALRRLIDIEKVAGGLLNIPSDNIALKKRTRQKGETQYERQSAQGRTLIVDENTVDGAVKFEVNLFDYLDTGLFLDHRKARGLIAKWIKLLAKDGKGTPTFLNLFSYTGTASVHAAIAGAETTTVDMSNTYLDWAKRNFSLNKINLRIHHFIRDNCLAWLEQAPLNQANYYDVIFIDPPTFSNSKKMDEHFDIQNDHKKLISQALELLKPGGKLLFSNNFKKFKMEYVSSEQVKVREITKETTSRDFVKKPLHRSWLIEKI
ncbi:MAG: bifunctional 23S rRNA (guanine(2069)-N(7))-methyltransferase RlmK/23S rRNA (guanine(2445)-N(2))-methyltransferase RlmL [Kangiellaceae bacterium]|jgi:23S rRNA (guanine2445-N2)-methyltransferase / 23S rRNA (guanine2069-N7)-methyltransferase|nr:bifunctional 23S rRNA (guanine(2069)-N(7))-methyltransferase RlmK/23S rRNA (guanine(2445)-N(2))-methyltransferase RlmL [Kangiellaceae bacterium]